MPHLAEQDDRRPVGTPARRARLVPAAIGERLAGRSPSDLPPTLICDDQAKVAELKLLVVTGPSGVGKGTLIRALRERAPQLALSTSATTRSPRPGEVDGRDYYFLSPEDFERQVERGEFLEHATYAGHRYGTPRSELTRAREGLVLEIELQGARQVRQAVPDAVQVFIAPPSEAALRERLEGRGTDTPEQIEGRLARAKEELAARREFEHVIVNDRLERAVDELAALAATIGCSSSTPGASPGEGEPA